MNVMVESAIPPTFQLNLLVLNKTFDSYKLHGPLSAPYWISGMNNTMVNIQYFFKSFYTFNNESSIENEFIIDNTNGTLVSMNMGLIERTGTNAHLNLIAKSGLRPPYEINYVVNLSYGNNLPSELDELWISANSPHPIQIWLGNTTTMYLVYTNSTGVQSHVPIHRPHGLTMLGIQVGSSGFKFLINGEVIYKGLYNGVYSNTTGWYPFSSFDLNSNVSSPLLLAVMVNQPLQNSVIVEQCRE